MFHDTSFYAMRRQFQSAHKKKKESVALKWNDLGEQDVIGQGSFGAVFITKARNKDGDSARKVETVVVKKSSAFKESRF